MVTRSFSCIALLALLSLLPTRLLAQRVYWPMGSEIQHTALVALADTAPSGEFNTALIFREILKGDAGLVGRIYVRSLDTMNSESIPVPKQATGVAVLLAPGWDDPKAPGDYVEEVYTDTKDIATLRIFLGIYHLPTEHERLAALQTYLHDPNPVFQQQWLQDLQTMRDHADYSFVSTGFADLNEDNQVKLLRLIGDIGDMRGVPLLIQAVASPKRSVSNEAALELVFRFPDAPGMQQAMQGALSDPESAPLATQFLIKHDPHNRRLKALLDSHQTTWTKAEALRQSGDIAESRTLYFQIVGDIHESDYTRRNAATELLAGASAADKNRIRPVLLSLLTQSVTAPDYEARTAATLLRELHHPDCLPALLQLLASPAHNDRPAIQTAVMAVRELGPAARSAAVAQTLRFIQSLHPFPTNADVLMSDQIGYFAELAWLGSKSEYQAAGLGLDKSYQLAWRQWLPLAGIAEQKDEGAFLVSALQAQADGSAEYSDDLTKWAIFRLGDLRDPRGVACLYHLLTRSVYSESGYAAAAALGNIHSPQNEKMALSLLTSPDKDWARPQAVQILAQIQGPKVLPLLRRILREPDFGDKRGAIDLLGKCGTPADLKSLRPLADFWTGNHDLQWVAGGAVERIRDRYNYDIYGPIKS